MPAPRLSEASYIVLGLLERMAPATPYDLKQIGSPAPADGRLVAGGS